MKKNFGIDLKRFELMGEQQEPSEIAKVKEIIENLDYFVLNSIF